MAEGRKIMPSEPVFSLTLDAEEAGYLKELLYTCVGGNLVCYGQPLGRILAALDDTRVLRRAIRNLNDEAPLNERRVYAAVYAENDPDADNWKWWESEEDDFFNEEWTPSDSDIEYMNRYR